MALTENEAVKIGLYDMRTDTTIINDSLIYWHERKGRKRGPPMDQIYRVEKVLPLNLAIQVLLISLAVLGQLLGIAFLAVNIKFRNRRSVTI